MTSHSANSNNRWISNPTPTPNPKSFMDPLMILQTVNHLHHYDDIFN